MKWPTRKRLAAEWMGLVATVIFSGLLWHFEELWRHYIFWKVAILDYVLLWVIRITLLALRYLLPTNFPDQPENLSEAFDAIVRESIRQIKVLVCNEVITEPADAAAAFKKVVLELMEKNAAMDRFLREKLTTELVQKDSISK